MEARRKTLLKVDTRMREGSTSIGCGGSLFKCWWYLTCLIKTWLLCMKTLKTQRWWRWCEHASAVGCFGHIWNIWTLLEVNLEVQLTQTVVGSSSVLMMLLCAEQRYSCSLDSETTFLVLGLPAAFFLPSPSLVITLHACTPLLFSTQYSGSTGAS